MGYTGWIQFSIEQLRIGGWKHSPGKDLSNLHQGKSLSFGDSFNKKPARCENFQIALKKSPLALPSIRAWMMWSGQVIFKAWDLGLNSTRVWMVWGHAKAASKSSIWFLVSINVWCFQICRRTLEILEFGAMFNQSFDRCPNSQRTWSFALNWSFLYSWFLLVDNDRKDGVQKKAHTQQIRYTVVESRWRSPLPKGICKVPWYFSQLV